MMFKFLKNKFGKFSTSITFFACFFLENKAKILQINCIKFERAM